MRSVCSKQEGVLWGRLMANISFTVTQFFGKVFVNIPSIFDHISYLWVWNQTCHILGAQQPWLLCFMVWFYSLLQKLFRFFILVPSVSCSASPSFPWNLTIALFWFCLLRLTPCSILAYQKYRYPFWFRPLLPFSHLFYSLIKFYHSSTCLLIMTVLYIISSQISSSENELISLFLTISRLKSASLTPSNLRL